MPLFWKKKYEKIWTLFKKKYERILTPALAQLDMAPACEWSLWRPSFEFAWPWIRSLIRIYLLIFRELICPCFESYLENVANPQYCLKNHDQNFLKARNYYWKFNRYSRKRPKVDAGIFNSALSHTRRSDATEKRKKIACPLSDVFSCGQVSSPRLFRIRSFIGTFLINLRKGIFFVVLKSWLQKFGILVQWTLISWNFFFIFWDIEF